MLARSGGGDVWTSRPPPERESRGDLRRYRTYGKNNDGLHVTTLYNSTDGSATRIDGMPDGPPMVTNSGPRDLWEPIEAGHRLCQELNRPRREWFTIEATAN
ncbi:hypothetical protein [Streptomyces coffeae]|uniref:Uncharacterized protein n=1 Tax=Streptomyces coffeae TaxID=621382 RepID=A0ABS1NNH6_9ACTN|nr:hypothetical protein [Streptomyces coffeae]MBL1101563.1 hypothetical protein [Streptomyces coffeae]